MPRVSFTRTLERHMACPPQVVSGATVREALEAVFERLPGLRGYLLDDQGHCRQHVALFVDGRQVADRTGLAEPVGADSHIYVMQALSGG